jgi:hypothetical protein
MNRLQISSPAYFYSKKRWPRFLAPFVFSPLTLIFSQPPTPAQGSITPCANGDGSFETIPLSYSKSTQIQTVLSQLDLGVGENCGKVIGTNIGSPNSIEIYGNSKGRESLARLIGSFDLPRERIHMDLWAIQISSANKAMLTDVMGQVQRQIDQTRAAMQLTYKELSDLSLKDYTPHPNVETLRNLGFNGLISASPNLENPRLSLTQMLLRLAMANEPVKNYNEAALNICNFFAKKENSIKLDLYNRFEGNELEAYDIQRIFNTDSPRSFRRPFQGFMTVGLHQKFPERSRQPYCGDGALTTDQDKKNEEKHAERRRLAILNFAKNYQQFQLYPSQYNPNELSRSSGIVDDLITPVVDAINADIEAYFIRPTLFKIRQIVGRNRGVEYAEVGRSTISGINGQPVSIVSGTVSSFDEPTPLRLSDWLAEANTESTNVSSALPLLTPPLRPGQAPPQAGQPQPGTPPNLGTLFPILANSSSPFLSILSTLPLSKGIALLSALSKEDVSWSSLNSGIKINLTPMLMRDQMRAAIDVKFTMADPATLKINKDQQEEYGPTLVTTSDTGKRPLSRISKSILDTKVYVNTMDLFALSSFNNQTTITGRRWYVPLVGTIWEGAFGDIPVLGGWFSFKRPPQNMQHQSVILTNTLIVPSAMGMASYYNNKNVSSNDSASPIPLDNSGLPNSRKVDSKNKSWNY